MGKKNEKLGKGTLEKGTGEKEHCEKGRRENGKGGKGKGEHMENWKFGKLGKKLEGEGGRKIGK